MRRLANATVGLVVRLQMLPSKSAEESEMGAQWCRVPPERGDLSNPPRPRYST